jgi:exodeoxyribonuclease VII large subunit
MSDLFSQPFEDDEPVDAAPRPRRVVSVAELTASIRAVLESGFGDLWVEGEISNCKRWNTGHLYFTLKDGSAQIRAVMY